MTDLNDLTDSSENWSDVFKQFIINNIRYWLDYSQNNPHLFLKEVPQILKALEYALPLAEARLIEAWLPICNLMLQISPLIIRGNYAIQWELPLSKAIICSKTYNEATEIKFRYNLGWLYHLQGRFSESKTCLVDTLPLCEQHQQGCWHVLALLALVSRSLHQYQQALRYCNQILANKKEVSVSIQAEALNVMGLVAYDTRQWEKALTHFNQAIELYHTLNDPYELARVFNNKGMVLQRIKQWDEAEKTYQEAIKQFELANGEVEIFKTVMNLGNIFLMRKKYQIAIDYYQKALSVFKKVNYLVDQTFAYNNLGLAYTGLSNWQEAEGCFKEASKTWRLLGNKYKLANVLDNLGKMFVKANEVEKAKLVLSEALKVLNEAPSTPDVLRLRDKVEHRLNELL